MKFPVWRTAIDALEYCWREGRSMIRFGAIPFLVTVAGAFTFQALGIDQTQSVIAIGILGIVQILIFLPLSVTWYRMTVLGIAEASNRPVFVLGRLEGRLLLWQIILLLIFSAAGALGAGVIGAIYGGLTAAGLDLIAGLIGAVLGVALVLALLVALSRLTMALVLAALDQPVSLKTAWRMTDGGGWRLLGAILLIGLAGVLLAALFQLAAFLVGAIGPLSIGGSLGAVLPYFRILGQSLSTFLTVLATATLFGLVYKMLVATTPPQSLQPSAVAL